MLATMPVQGYLAELNPSDSIWFKLVGGSSSDSSVMVGDSSYRVYTKEIKRYLKSEDDKDRKAREEDEEDEEAPLPMETAEMRARRLIPIRKRAELNAKLTRLEELKQLREQITDFKGFDDQNQSQWSFLQLSAQLKDVEEMDPTDIEQVHRLTIQINSLTSLVEALKGKVEAAEKEYGVTHASKVATLLKNNRKASELCEAEAKFMKDFYLLVDGVTVWQEEFRYSEYFTIDSANFQTLYDLVASTLIQSISKNNTDAFLADTTKHIITSTVNFYEREEYRNNYSGGGIFNLMSVVASIRSEEHTVIKDFPDDIEPLVTDFKNDYYVESNNYFMFWWITQNIGGIKPHRSVFFLDIEEEYLSLDRVDIRSPVISRLGDTWVIVEPGEWTSHGALKCIRVSNQLSQAFCAWMFKIAKNKWIIHNRETDTFIDISNLLFRDIWLKAFGNV
jgi:hypothetical protein